MIDRITKDKAALNLGSALTGTTNTTAANQIDSANRVCLAVLAPSFYGFVPVPNGGLDIHRTTADGQPTVDSVPAARKDSSTPGVGSKRLPRFCVTNVQSSPCSA